MINILIVEDDSLSMQTSKKILRPFGKIFSASSEKEAYEIIQSNHIDLGIFDLNLNGELSGLRLISFAKLHNIYPIVLSSEIQSSIFEKAFKNGAHDYLNKPFSLEKLSIVMNRFENNMNHLKFEQIINDSYITKSSEQTKELYKIKNLSVSNKPIFIEGETGTGKRVVAHIIQEILDCSNFLEINCSQFTDELFSSELFGHKKGSFTGATEDKVGLLEKANNGIIFLDEIHGLSIKSQKTLLKAIEEKEFYPVGASTKVKSNFRLISATCEDINDLIAQGLFRKDLYGRISTFNISLLPLRSRKEDIMLLFKHFISTHLIQIVISDDTKEILEKYSWPRNTREIQDLVENWVVHGNRLISGDVLPAHIKNNIVKTNRIISDVHLDLLEELGLKEFLTVFKKEVIQELLKRHNGVAKNACEAMDASPSYVSRFLSLNKQKTFLRRSVDEKT